MRRALPIAVLALCAAACGSASHRAAPPPRLPPFASAPGLTLRTGSAHLTQTTSIVVGGAQVDAHDTGTVAFDGSRAHLYKLSPASNVPGEVIVVGPITFSNADVQASLMSGDVRPWTRLDTRKLTAGEERNRPDELAHVLAPAYLAYGARAVSLARRVADGAVYWARIDPALVLRRVPRARRALIAKALSGDYPAKDFNAKFWIDRRDRIRRVIVAYATAQGTPVAIDTSYDSFGVRVPVAPPPAREVKDITP
ncbi:MAG TPA: hypothetical protein VE982_01580 [Gaiellaceae bacterium]|nr:hypothetical protein [Gaiellaceae bacterium]